MLCFAKYPCTFFFHGRYLDYFFHLQKNRPYYFTSVPVLQNSFHIMTLATLSLFWSCRWSKSITNFPEDIGNMNKIADILHLITKDSGDELFPLRYQNMPILILVNSIFIDKFGWTLGCFGYCFPCLTRLKSIITRSFRPRWVHGIAHPKMEFG